VRLYRISAPLRFMGRLGVCLDKVSSWRSHTHVITYSTTFLYQFLGDGNWGTTSVLCTRRLRQLPVGVDRGRHEHRHSRRVLCIGLDVVDAGDAVFRHTGRLGFRVGASANYSYFRVSRKMTTFVIREKFSRKIASIVNYILWIFTENNTLHLHQPLNAQATVTSRC